MVANLQNILPGNFPQPPNKQVQTDFFPNDLGSVQSKTGDYFATQIEFNSYGAGGNRKKLTTVYLPIPKKLNDIENIVWDPFDGISLGAEALEALRFSKLLEKLPTGVKDIINSGAAGLASQAAAAQGAFTGYIINPFLWMLFKSPTFKEHVFSWTFNPSNEQESNTIINIINKFKKHASPTLQGVAGGIAAGYGYPDIALITFHPADKFTFKIKPCAILSVQVDHTASGMPSFFNNGAPTTINLTVVFKEIELWTQEDFSGDL